MKMIQSDEETSNDCTRPCVVTVDCTYISTEDIGDAVKAAQTAFTFGGVLHLGATLETVYCLTELINDHLSNLPILPVFETLRNALFKAGGQCHDAYFILVAIKPVLFAAKCQINFYCWQKDECHTHFRELSFEPEMNSLNAVSDDLLFQNTIYRATTGDLVYFTPND